MVFPSFTIVENVSLYILSTPFCCSLVPPCGIIWAVGGRWSCLLVRRLLGQRGGEIVMDIDKIREVTRDVAEKVNREHPLVTHEGIADTISKAVAAAFEEYERQKHEKH